MAGCTVYIDEAGDLGIRRGTQWFVLTAVVVEKDKEKAIRSKMDFIKNKLNVRELHIRKINDFFKRAFIVRGLAEEDFVYFNVIVDTNKFDAEKIPATSVAYNYICKYLLQRVSIYLEQSGQVADIVLSARGTSRDGELIQYIQEKLLPYKANRIPSECYEKVLAKSASVWDMLQLADVCATTMFFRYEINGLGFCVPCFSQALKKHLYRKDDQIEKFGIKYFTNDMKPDLSELDSNCICKMNK